MNETSASAAIDLVSTNLCQRADGFIGVTPFANTRCPRSGHGTTGRTGSRGCSVRPKLRTDASDRSTGAACVANALEGAAISGLRGRGTQLRSILGVAVDGHVDVVGDRIGH